MENHCLLLGCPNICLSQSDQELTNQRTKQPIISAEKLLPLCRSKCKPLSPGLPKCTPQPIRSRIRRSINQSTHRSSRKSYLLAVVNANPCSPLLRCSDALLDGVRQVGPARTDVAGHRTKTTQNTCHISLSDHTISRIIHRISYSTYHTSYVIPGIIYQNYSTRPESHG